MVELLPATHLRKEAQAKKLKDEGIKFQSERTVDLSKHQYFFTN